jgi:hypothetical protein
MKKLLMTLALFLAVPAFAEPLHICKGQFAFCGASGTTPTGKDIIVLGQTFKEGMSVCPVMTGDAVANFTLMQNSCDAPKGKVWSLFASFKSVPQAPTWENLPTVTRTFVTTNAPGGGMSNMWSMLCDIQPKQVNGVTLANCYGPMNESPWTNQPVPVGATFVTQAAVGSPNPVGGRVPAQVAAKLESKKETK